MAAALTYVRTVRSAMSVNVPRATSSLTRRLVEVTYILCQIPTFWCCASIHCTHFPKRPLLYVHCEHLWFVYSQHHRFEIDSREIPRWCLQASFILSVHTVLQKPLFSVYLCSVSNAFLMVLSRHRRMREPWCLQSNMYQPQRRLQMWMLWGLRDGPGYQDV